MSSDNKSNFDGTHYLVLAAIFALFTLIWFFYYSDEVVVYLRKHWLEWYGVEYFDASEWHTIPVFLLVMMVPTFAMGGIAIFFSRKVYYLNFASIHETNLQKLDDAKFALQQSIASVEAIATEVKINLKKYELLEKELEELRVAKSIDAIALKKTLSAINSTNRKSVWIDRVLGFLLGVASSLIASYIWERLMTI